MASESVIAKLAAKPPRVQLGVLAGILVAGGLIYWQVLYSSADEERSGLKGRKATLTSQIEALRKDARDLESLRRERQERKLKIEKGLLKLPAESELPAFLKQLQNQAGAAGVKLKNYAQVGEYDVDDFVKVVYKIEANGTFFQLTRYFWLLWEYSKSESGLIITIENLDLDEATASPDGLVLTAKFSAATFRQAAGATPAPAAAPAAEAKGSKAKVEDAKKQREGAVEKSTGEAAAGDKAREPAGKDRLNVK